MNIEPKAFQGWRDPTPEEHKEILKTTYKRLRVQPGIFLILAWFLIGLAVATFIHMETTGSEEHISIAVCFGSLVAAILFNFIDYIFNGYRQLATGIKHHKYKVTDIEPYKASVQAHNGNEITYFINVKDRYNNKERFTANRKMNEAFEKNKLDMRLAVGNNRTYTIHFKYK